jgi:beta-glucuronidase
MTAGADPFHHLHDEDYLGRFSHGEATSATLVTIAGRPMERLDGAWRFTPDFFDEGLRQNWPALDERAPGQWSEPRDYDIEAGDVVSIPCCWNLLKPEWMHFEGAGWYARDLVWTSRADGERAILAFEGANYAARVFVNGALAGGHRGGSTPFSIEITSLLRAGANRLQIMVENRRRPDRAPMHHIDWFNYGGLYRSVGLLRLPPVFIRDFGVALVPDGTFARMSVDVTLSDAVDGDAIIHIPGLGLRQTIAIAGGRGVTVIAATPELWSPDRPRLYDVELIFGDDRVADRIGFREIRTEGTGILLNGAPLYLRGVCVHEDDAATGKASSEEDLRRRFVHARDLNCNFLRLAHYPHDRRAAQIADEMGFLLWAEIPVYWAIDFGNPATFADAENQLRELIARDRNRASVILWGVGNENADTDARYRFMAALARAARAADPTRLVTAACLINRERFAIEDRLAADLDVIGLNEYFGWYEPDFSGLERLLANSSPDRPVIVSETGADAQAGHRGAGRVLFTEDWQAEFFRQQFRRLAAAPYVRGVAVWLLYDFRSERRQTRFQKGFNRKGLIGEDKATKKLAFDVVASIYSGMGG